MRAPVNPDGPPPAHLTGVLAVAGKSGQRRGQPGGLLTWVAAVVPVRLVRDAPSRGQRPPRHAKPSLLACSSCSARVLWFCGKQARVCSVSWRNPFGGPRRQERARRAARESRGGRGTELQGHHARPCVAALAGRRSQLSRPGEVCKLSFEIPPLANLQLGFCAVLRIQPP